MINAGTKSGRERRKCDSLVCCLAVLIVLSWSGLCPAEIPNPILNPSFEDVYFTGWSGSSRVYVPRFWDWVEHTSFESNTTTVWNRDGIRSAWLSSRIGVRPFAPGDYQSFRIEVDLTEVGAIVFDAMLTTHSGADFGHFEASFWVYDYYGTGAPQEEQARLWRATEGDEYLDQVVDVSGFSGLHWIEIRLTSLVTSGGFGISYWALWDNLRVLAGEPEPEVIEAFIDLEPNTLNLRSQGKWITCYIAMENPEDTLLIDGTTVALEGIPAHMGREGWAKAEANEENTWDLDGNGMLVRMVKFDRAAVGAIVQPPETVVTVTGLLFDGTPFEGFAVIRVIDQGGKRR